MRSNSGYMTSGMVNLTIWHTFFRGPGRQIHPRDPLNHTRRNIDGPRGWGQTLAGWKPTDVPQPPSPTPRPPPSPLLQIYLNSEEPFLFIYVCQVLFKMQFFASSYFSFVLNIIRIHNMDTARRMSDSIDYCWTWGEGDEGKGCMLTLSKIIRRLPPLPPPNPHPSFYAYANGLPIICIYTERNS